MLIRLNCVWTAGVSLMFSAEGQLFFTCRQNYLNWTLFLEKLSSRWSNQLGKIVFTAGLMKPLELFEPFYQYSFAII